MKKYELLEKTAASILSTPDYKWSSGNRCNIGLLIEAARGSRATPEEFRQGGQIIAHRLNLRGLAMWCCAGEDNHIIKWLRAEYLFTAREIEAIELLNDKSIVRLLARRGIRPAPLFNRSRKYVAAYIAALAAREKRRARARREIPIHA